MAKSRPETDSKDKVKRKEKKASDDKIKKSEKHREQKFKEKKKTREMVEKRQELIPGSKVEDEAEKADVEDNSTSPPSQEDKDLAASKKERKPRIKGRVLQEKLERKAKRIEKRAQKAAMKAAVDAAAGGNSGPVVEDAESSDDAVQGGAPLSGETEPSSGLNRRARRRLILMAREKEAIQKSLGVSVESTEPHGEVDRQLAAWVKARDEKARRLEENKKARLEKEATQVRNRRGKVLTGQALKDKMKQQRRQEKSALRKEKYKEAKEGREEEERGH